MKYDFLIVGAGISGCVIAERLANILGKKVLIVDSRDHIGGNCYDYRDENGIIIHKYGPHVFHTNIEKVWQYVSQYTKWHLYFHKVLGLVDGIEIPVPFNFNSLYSVFPPAMAKKYEEKLLENFPYNSKISILKLRKSDDETLKFLADYIYEKIFLNYTIKQWELDPNEIDPSVTARIPIYLSRDDGYFQDKYQAIPQNGYTPIFEKMLNHQNIEVRLNTKFQDIKDNIEYDKLVYTGKIDEFFDNKHGELPYRSLEFALETHELEYYQKVAQHNYPNNFDFTRITEYKHFLNTKSNKTVIAKEYSYPHIPSKNEAYYPVIQDENRKLYDRYANEAKEMKNIYFTGRLAEYRYYNMDQTFNSALELFEVIRKEYE